METAERPAPSRRVGTFTLGVVLVAAGTMMLASWFVPWLGLWQILKAAPLILISLGVETLLAARGGGKVRYDWAGMLLIFLLTAGAVGLYACAWYLDAVQEARASGGLPAGGFECRDGTGFEYEAFSGPRHWDLTLDAGDMARVEAEAGTTGAEAVRSRDGEPVCVEKSLGDAGRAFGAAEDGAYDVCVTGRQSSGRLRIYIEQRAPAHRAGLSVSEREGRPS